MAKGNSSERVCREPVKRSMIKLSDGLVNPRAAYKISRDMSELGIRCRTAFSTQKHALSRPDVYFLLRLAQVANRLPRREIHTVLQHIPQFIGSENNEWTLLIRGRRYHSHKKKRAG